MCRKVTYLPGQIDEQHLIGSIYQTVRNDFIVPVPITHTSNSLAPLKYHEPVGLLHLRFLECNSKIRSVVEVRSSTRSDGSILWF